VRASCDGDPDGAAEGDSKEILTVPDRAHRSAIPKVMRKVPPIEMQNLMRLDGTGRRLRDANQTVLRDGDGG
jgi:hypothetical protein